MMMNNYLSMDYSFLVPGLKGDRMVAVSNMARTKVAYEIEEMGITRDFRQFEYGIEPDKKNLPFGELYALNNLPGGSQLIWDNLKVDDNMAREALGLPLAEDTPEVEYTRKEVAKVLRSGTESEILDMLEFGPYYIAQWVKEEAVNIDSTTRKKFIGHVLKIDIDNLAANLEWASQDEEAGRLQYGSIQGVDELGGEVTAQRKRRSSSKIAKPADGDASKPRRRAATK